MSNTNFSVSVEYNHLNALSSVGLNDSSKYATFLPQPSYLGILSFSGMQTKVKLSGNRVLNVGFTQYGWLHAESGVEVKDQGSWYTNVNAVYGGVYYLKDSFAEIDGI
jgi:hypothetical protein